MHPKKPVGISKTKSKGKQVARVTKRQQTSQPISKGGSEDLSDLEDYNPDEHDLTLSYSSDSRNKKSRIDENSTRPIQKPATPLKWPYISAFKLGQAIGHPHIMEMSPDTHLRYYKKHGNGTLSGAELAVFVDQSYGHRFITKGIAMPPPREANTTSTPLLPSDLQSSTPRASMLPALIDTHEPR
jgi:hypothetical protein